MKFRATCNLIFDFETDLPQEEALELARKYLNGVKFDKDLQDTRIVLQVDKLKNKTERIKLGEFDFDEVYPYVTEEPSKREYCVGDVIYLVKMNSDRYMLFRTNSSCVSCNLEITKIFLECYETDKTPHFNMYGQENNKLILFTKDHIQARAIGGENSLSNYQTMCSICNSLKAHSNLEIESLRKLRSMYDEKKKVLTKKKLHLYIEEERKKLEKPWFDHIVSSSSPTKLSHYFLYDCLIIESEGNLIARQKEDVGCDKILGHVLKGTCLEPVIEINNTICFSMNGNEFFYADKNLLSKKE